jgi:hypothetical protein
LENINLSLIQAKERNNMGDRIDGILFDVKESIDDFGNEIKLLMAEVNRLSEKVRILEEKGKT